LFIKSFGEKPANLIIQMKNNKENSQGTALVTGGAKRIGREIALELSKMGYDLVVHYNNSASDAQSLKNQIEDLGVSCSLIKADLLDKAQVEDLVSKMRKIKNWNLLVNNASVFDQSNFLQSDADEMEKNFIIHLKIPAILSRTMAENCEDNSLNGNIINIVDKNIVRFDTKYFDYILSKKSLAELTKMLAVQLAPKIRVNAIAPGFLDNVHGKDSEEETSKLSNKIPLQRTAKKSDVICGMKYLLNNDFVTGEILFIDGGASLNHAG
jgi:pteridine reductase